MAALKILYFLLWQYFLSSIVHAAVNVFPQNIEGLEGTVANVSLSWTTEQIVSAKIVPRDLSPSDQYYTQCLFDGSSSICSDCFQLRGSNINSTCSDKQIVWTFHPLERRNNAAHLVKFIARNQNNEYNLQVNVFAPPSLLSLSCSDTDVTVNSSVTCLCSAVSGNPKTSPLWSLQTQNGQSISLTDTSQTSDFDIFGHFNSSLTFPVLMEHNGANLKCLTQNSYGSKEETVKLNVKTLPNQPTDLKFENVGEAEVRFSWSPGDDGGYPQTFYVRYWRDTTVLEVFAVQPSILLKFADLDPDTSYNFIVFASNKIGNGTEAKTEYKTPKAEDSVTIPKSSDGMVGDQLNVTMKWSDEKLFKSEIKSAVLQGEEQYSTECFFATSNQQCSDCVSFKKSNIKAACLVKEILFTFDSLRENNHGKHIIDLRTESGTFIVKETFVTVWAQPRDLKLTSNTSSWIENSTVEMECSGVSGNPLSHFRWYLNRGNNDSVIDLTQNANTSGTQILTSISSVLRYEPRMEEDGAVIECVLENQYGSVNESLVVDIKYRPRIISSPSDRRLMFNESDSIDIECIAEGNPQPTIQWKFPDGSLNKAPRLIMTNVNRTNNGTYECEASNTIGSSSKIFPIEIKYGPECVPQKTSIIVINQTNINSNIILNCLADSYPLSGVFWWIQKGNLSFNIDASIITAKYQIHSKVSNSLQSSQLTIKALNIGDEGSYECHFLNEEKDCKLTTRVIFSKTPGKPNSLVIKEVDNKTIQLSWIPGEIGGLAETFFVKYEMRKDSVHSVTEIKTTFPSLLIKNLVSGARYQFTVTGANKEGHGIRSESLTFYTPFSETGERREATQTQQPLLSTGAIVGISLGCLIFGIVLGLVIFYLVTLCRQKSVTNDTEDTSEKQENSEGSQDDYNKAQDIAMEGIREGRQTCTDEPEGDTYESVSESDACDHKYNNDQNSYE